MLLLMGVGEAASWPVSVKAIQENFLPTQRGVAVGYFNSGSAVGAVLAPIVVTHLALRYSWRTAFVVFGLIGFLWVIPWLLLYPGAQRNSQKIERAHRDEADAPRITDTRCQGVGCNPGTLFRRLNLVLLHFLAAGLLSRARGFSMSIIGMTVWIPFLAAGLGNVAGGSISGILIRRGVPAGRARLRVMLVSAAAMVLGAGVWFCGNPVGAIALISFVVFAYSSWAANVLTIPSDLFAADAVATTVGFSGAAAGVGGMLTTSLAGIVIDHYSYEPVFLGLGLLPICASACALLMLANKQQTSTTCLNI